MKLCYGSEDWEATLPVSNQVSVGAKERKEKNISPLQGLNL